MSIIGVTQYVVPAILVQALDVPGTTPEPNSLSSRQVSQDAGGGNDVKALPDGAEQAHAAPPSVLQLKILALLKEQEEAIQRDGDKKSSAHDSEQSAGDQNIVSPASNPFNDAQMPRVPHSNGAHDPSPTISADFVTPAMSPDAPLQKTLATDEAQWGLTQIAPHAPRDLHLGQVR